MLWPGQGGACSTSQSSQGSKVTPEDSLEAGRKIDEIYFNEAFNQSFFGGGTDSASRDAFERFSSITMIEKVMVDRI